MNRKSALHMLERITVVRTHRPDFMWVLALYSWLITSYTSANIIVIQHIEGKIKTNEKRKKGGETRKYFTGDLKPY